MEYVDADQLLRDVRSKQRAVSERANRILSKRGTVSRRSVPKLDEMTAEELEKDTATLERFLVRFKGGMKRASSASTIHLPSGREYTVQWGSTRGAYERAVPRSHKYQKR
jgi:hypothetical protein